MAKLYASAAHSKITPSKEMLAQWNVWGSKKFSAPYCDIYVHALVFSDQEGHYLVHVGGDLIMTLDDSLRQEICKQLNIPASCVFFSCTHNHMVLGTAVPGTPDAATGGPFGGGPGTKAWTDMVYDQARDAVHRAVATLRPARIGAGHGVSGISVNREWNTPVGSLGTGDRNGETVHEISVLRVDELDGKPIAVMINSNAHAGSLFGGSVGLANRITGGDVAGYVSEFVGNAIGQGVVPMWAIGGAGDQNTYFHSGMMWPSVDDKGQFQKETYIMSEEDAIKIARNTAAIQCMEALKVYNDITEFSEHFDLKTGINYKTITRVKPARPGLIGAGPGGPGAPGAPNAGPAPREVASNVNPTAPTAAPLPQTEEIMFRFYLITLNGIAFAGANSESFIGLKKAALGVLPNEQKFWMDMNFDGKASHAGYIPSARYDRFYEGGKRNGLQANLLAFNGNDMLKLYADGISELVKTIA